MSEDLYAILGVPRDADEGEIRSAHRALAKKYHPDAGTGSSSERFRNIQYAYDVLSDRGRRTEYDRLLRRQEQQPRRTAPPIRFHSGGYATFATHVDLRHLSRGVRTERIEFGPRTRYAGRESDPWEALLAFLFGDLE